VNLPDEPRQAPTRVPKHAAASASGSYLPPSAAVSPSPPAAADPWERVLPVSPQPTVAAEPPVREPAPAPQRGGGRPSALRLIWIYPDLLSTYGDRGNLVMLTRRAALRGLDVEPIGLNSDQPVPRQGDVYLLGGGEDLPQVLAAKRLRADGGLAAAAADGAVVFAVCAGYQLIGEVFGGAQGEPVEGLGLLDIRSGRGERRGVGEIIADVDPALGVDRLTGFENHQGVTSLGRDAKPLAQVALGVGNGDGTEGAYAGRILGTYLHGPALVRNPSLADLLLSWAVGTLPPLPEAHEVWTTRLRTERLAAVSA
jgi:lipid II isoglutaminyl synthase (glutamine-hydrolysing)